ncbi:DegT/DnrJ/EryC1/StrS family aminotransferase [Prochlorococcus sp. MIT 1307]|uniref:DegT/DnrJ/EryC1/StrS family aminotransferase n=1 Tax=Prochlorococcus sp. MIT 1307 TaxID=3096219 RepID=UPI002A757046|nr:DegT/DnrJ/EryC1/StrS family aminotransferase [Prochlorococcus sp. MIT 1307]
MNKNRLALLGGSKLIDYTFAKYNSIGKEEKVAVSNVMDSGCLSKFLGCWDEDFYGGPEVKRFERACKSYFKVQYAVTVNSWTSGLICALGAIGVEPGDEVIVTPWTMCATATSILHWNAIPVFADIDKRTFNLDIQSVKNNITENTKVIMAADIFGQSCDVVGLNEIALENNIKLITDSAQSPGSITSSGLTGTLADIGGFSLNYHKHIHTGEGGIIVTNSENYYQRLALIRNHAEAAVQGMKVQDLSNMIGHNFRLGEIESAIGCEQLKKLDGILERRRQIGFRLTEGLKGLKGLITPYIEKGNTHSFYIYPMILDVDLLGLPRKTIKAALEAEGLKGLIEGYANIHMLPIFQEKTAYGKKGFPWSSDICKREVNYQKGICPNAEELHDKTFLGYEMCLHQLDDKDVEMIISVFHKVWDSIGELISRENL